MSDLFAPIAGTIVAFNQELLNDPSAINVDSYGAGWLFEMEGDAGDTADVRRSTTSSWPTTGKRRSGMIKGKINTED